MPILEPTATALTKRRPRHWQIVIVCGVLTAIAYFWPASEQPAPEPAKARQAGTVFGPGKWQEPNANDANRSEANGPMPPGGLAVSDSQQLQIDLALLNLIDFYLLDHAGPDGVNSLHSYLKNHLPPPAYGEAARIVDQYQAYMKAHDALLASQNLGVQGASLQALNIDRIQTWLEQRNRLRQTMLGDRVVQVWYQGDDEELKQALDEARRRIGQTIPQPSPAQETDASSRAMNAGENAQQERDILEVFDRATKSYGTLAYQRTHQS